MGTNDLLEPLLVLISRCPHYVCVFQCWSLKISKSFSESIFRTREKCTLFQLSSIWKPNPEQDITGPEGLYNITLISIMLHYWCTIFCHYWLINSLRPWYPGGCYSQSHFIPRHLEEMRMRVVGLHMFCIQILSNATKGRQGVRQSFPDEIRDVRKCFNQCFEPSLLNLIEWTWVRKANIVRSVEDAKINIMQFYLQSSKSREAGGFVTNYKTKCCIRGKGRRDWFQF